MSTSVIISSAVGRRFSRAGRMPERPRAGPSPSPVELRDLRYRAAWVAEIWRGLDAHERNQSPGSRNAVSLRVQPQLVLTLSEALARAAPGIKAAFVYGPAAQAQAGPQRDVDLIVIGNASYADCFAGLLKAEKLLKRRIHARFVRAEEWRRKRARGSAFVTKLNGQPRLLIFASANDLRL